MSEIKIYCYDRVCQCWADKFELHANNCVSINQVWATSDVDLYVDKKDFDNLIAERDAALAEVERLKQYNEKRWRRVSRDELFAYLENRLKRKLTKDEQYVCFFTWDRAIDSELERITDKLNTFLGNRNDGEEG